MTKKKMRKLIIAGMLIFFVASSLMNFFFVWSEEEDIFRDNVKFYISGERMQTISETFENNNSELYNESPEKFKEYFLYEYIKDMRYLGYPYSVAIADREGNLTFGSNNFVHIECSDFSCVYVDVDPYLTDELKKDMRKYLKAEKNLRMQYVDEISVYYNGEEYIPVKIKCSLHSDEEGKEFILTDYEPTIVFKEENTWLITPCLMEIISPLRYKPYLNKLRESVKNHFELNKEHFRDSYGAGYSMTGARCVGSSGTEIGDGYEVYFAFAYNSVVDTITSKSLYALTIYLASLFAIAGIIFYIMCMKVISKSEKLDEAKSTFISGASHELKTPLAVIQNQCECIMENIAPEKNEEYIKSIYDEALRMNGIVTSLLNYNKISQMTAVEKERCNLSELLKEEVKSYGRFAENSGVTIVENIADNIYTDCNVQLMKMAIDNYLSNAVKHSVGDKNVQVNLVEKNGRFTIAVINDANESDVKNAQESWDEFSRGDKARSRQGQSIGMGLPICKKIFELHGFNGYCKYNEGRVSFVVTGS